MEERVGEMYIDLRDANVPQQAGRVRDNYEHMQLRSDGDSHSVGEYLAAKPVADRHDSIVSEYIVAKPAAQDMYEVLPAPKFADRGGAGAAGAALGEATRSAVDASPSLPPPRPQKGIPGRATRHDSGPRSVPHEIRVTLLNKVKAGALPIEKAEELFRLYESGADIPAEYLSAAAGAAGSTASAGAPAAGAPGLPPARAAIPEDAYIERMMLGIDKRLSAQDGGSMQDAMNSILERHRQGRSRDSLQ